MKKQWQSGLIIIVLLLLAGINCTVSGQAAKRPNIIFILSDDHAYQAMSAYSKELAVTPNIDRIANEGARFDNFFVTNSICGPSRATLLTGKFSHKNGFKTNRANVVFDNTQETFATVLSQNDYQTAWIGKWHLHSLPKGFDYWKILPGQGSYYNPDFIGPKNDTVRYEGYVSDKITEFSIEWLNQRQKDKPFVLVMGEKATHRSWLPDLEDLGAYDDINFPIPATFYDEYETRIAAQNQDMTIDKTLRLKEDLKIDVDYEKSWDYRRFTPEQEKIFKGYYQDKISKEFHDKNLSGKALAEWKYQRYLKDYLATARSMDRNIGKMLDFLDEKGLAENTIVIYTSDQGFYMGEHGWFDKRFMYEQSMRTGMVMRYPGVIAPGTVIKNAGTNIDWAPTILDITGVKPPAFMQGKSLLPLVKGKNVNKPVKRDLYYHYYEYPDAHNVAPHFGIRSDRYKLIRFYGPQQYWEFFDLETDPMELNNIYGQKKYSQLIEDHKKRLKRLIENYQDDEAAALFN